MSEKLINQLKPSGFQQVWEKAGFDRPTSIQVICNSLYS